MRITNMPTVSFDDIAEHFGFSFSDVDFTNCVENGSYVGFELDEDANERRVEALQDLERVGRSATGYGRKVKNELEIARYFNSLGYNDEILIYVNW